MEGEPIPYTSEKYKEYFDRMYALRGLIPDMSDEDLAAAMKEISDMGKYLINKYPDHKAYAFYHIIAGSGIDQRYTKIEHEDFPGEDSVAAFIEELEKKYGSG